MRSGWETEELQNIASIKGGYAFKSHLMTQDLGRYQVVKMSNLYGGVLDLSRSPSYIDNISDREAAYKLISNDIIITLTGTVGKKDFGYSDIIRSNENLLLNQRLAVLKANKLKADPDFLLYIIKSEKFLDSFFECSVGGTGNQANVSTERLKEIAVEIPPLPEQRKIAAILRTWDEAIEKTESLIKANEKRLFLLTTSLIFGHARLGKRPTHERTQHKWVSSPKDWKLQQIGDIAVERSELNTGGATHTVLSCSKHDGFVRSLDYFKKQIFSKNLAGYKTIYRGDFGFPSNHVEEGSIGLQNLEDKALVSPIYIIFTPDEKRIHADFLFRLLKTKTYAHIFRASTSSSVDRRGNLRWAEFSSIPVCLPDLKEQQEISEFLTGQQNLIDDLYRYKHALQSQKRGLMQKLLTGEWRVQVDKEAA